MVTAIGTQAGVRVRRTHPLRLHRRWTVQAAAVGVLTGLGVGLLAFDDVQPLRALGGGTLASPGWIPLLIAGLLAVSRVGLRGGRVLLLGAGAIVLYATVLTIVTAASDPSVAYGVTPGQKAIRALGAFVIWIAVLLAGFVLVRAAPKAMLAGVVVMLAVMLAGALLYRLGNHALDDFWLFHSAGNAQQRVRSTRFEASSLGGGALAATALGVLLVGRPRTRLLLALGGLLATVLLTDSRGTELIAATGVVLLLVLTLVTRFRRPGPVTVTAVIVAVVAVVITASLALGGLVQSDLWRALGLSDGARGTSDATRAGWAAVSTQVLLASPLGLGFGSYLQETPRLLQEVLQPLSSVYSSQALLELTRSAQGLSEVGVSPKSAPTLAAFHLGWPGLIAIFILWVSVVRGAWGRARSTSVPLAVTVLCVLLVAAGYYASYTAWEQALLAGAVLGAAATARGGRHSSAPASWRTVLTGARRADHPTRR